MCVMCERFVIMNFLSSRAAKQAADDIKTVREDLTIKTDDGAAFARESAMSYRCYCLKRATVALEDFRRFTHRPRSFPLRLF